MDENEKDEFTLKEMLFGDDKEYEEYKIYLEEEKRKEDSVLYQQGDAGGISSAARAGDLYARSRSAARSV